MLLELLIGSISRRRLHGVDGLVVGRDPRRHACLGDVAQDVGVYAADELVMDILNGRVLEELLHAAGELGLIQIACPSGSSANIAGHGG